MIAFERSVVVARPASITCPVCRINTELLTTKQAGSLLQVKANSIRRWIVQGRAHGIKTPGGQHRVCKNSLWIYRFDSVLDSNEIVETPNLQVRTYDSPR